MAESKDNQKAENFLLTKSGALQKNAFYGDLIGAAIIVAAQVIANLVYDTAGLF